MLFLCRAAAAAPAGGTLPATHPCLGSFPGAGNDTEGRAGRCWLGGGSQEERVSGEICRDNEGFEEQEQSGDTGLAALW